MQSFWLFACLFMCISALHHLCVWCPWRSEEGIESLGTRVMDGCEPPVGAGIWTELLCKNSKFSQPQTRAMQKKRKKKKPISKVRIPEPCILYPWSLCEPHLSPHPPYSPGNVWPPQHSLGRTLFGQISWAPMTWCCFLVFYPVAPSCFLVIPLAHTTVIPHPGY